MIKANNPDFQKVIEQITELHNKKSNDYAQNDNFYSNFQFAAFVGGVTVDQVFRVILGIKLARLKEFMSGKTPNFESIEDTRLDLTNYAAIYSSYTGPQNISTSLLEGNEDIVIKALKKELGWFPVSGNDEDILEWLSQAQKIIKNNIEKNNK